MVAIEWGNEHILLELIHFSIDTHLLNNFFHGTFCVYSMFVPASSAGNGALQGIRLSWC